MRVYSLNSRFESIGTSPLIPVIFESTAMAGVLSLPSVINLRFEFVDVIRSDLSITNGPGRCNFVI